jgi:hypothetical protein
MRPLTRDLRRNRLAIQDDFGLMRYLQGIVPGRRGRQKQAECGMPALRLTVDSSAGGLKNYFLEQSWDLTGQGVAFLTTL